MASIRLHDVSVEFPVRTPAAHSLQLRLWSTVGGKLAAHAKSLSVRALSKIDLTINGGDRIGLVGNNGAGKTTLLRVLAGAYPPTSGTIERVGRITALTDISLGMDPEATGLENILFRLVFMGLTFAEARKLSPEIEEFSELGEHLKMPVHTYSSGMYLRLAFSISTAVEFGNYRDGRDDLGGRRSFYCKSSTTTLRATGKSEHYRGGNPRRHRYAGLLQPAYMAGPRRNTRNWPFRRNLSELCGCRIR